VTTSITDVAQALGLSVSTVSRALNGYRDVSEATRERVAAKAQAMGYRPNSAARRLVSGKSSAVGVVLPSLVDEGQFIDSMYSRLLAGVAAALESTGYHVFATTLAKRDPQQELELFRNFINDGWVDALLIVRTRVHDARVQLAQQANIPFITYGRTDSPAPYSWVDSDNKEAFRLGVQRQAGFGHKRIALLNGPSEHFFARLREHGYELGLQQARLPLDPALVLHGDLSVRSGFELTTRLLKMASPPTAILCATDAMALGAISACRALGLVVGRDVSIMGYGNSESSLYCDPPLTTIEHQVFDNGRRVGEGLLQLLTPGNTATFHHLEPVVLVPRASDGPCRSAAG
jgi:LacI family transcriptional regulator